VAKRTELKADREKTVNMPTPPKREQRELEEFLRFMFEQIEQRYKTQVFGKIQKSTEAKFTDAQVGNYAAVYEKLANAAVKKINKQFNAKRIHTLVKRILGRADKRNREVLYAEIDKQIGIDKRKLMAEEAMTSTFNALVLETEQWINRLKDDHLRYINAASVRAMAEGKPLQEVLSRMTALSTKSKEHKAKFVARNQINSFNSLSNKVRVQKLGIKEAIWKTVRDGDRVRESHQDRHGKRYDISKGLYSSLDGEWLHPGTDYQCRCRASYVIPEFEDIEDAA
jgi:SPP1 gp7 family putative phage head morphogenesis protein